MRRTSHFRFAVAGLAGTVLATVLPAAATPAYALPGLTTIAVVTTTDSSSPKTAVASCPAGTTVLGGGGYVAGGTGQVKLTGLRPLVSFFGTGFEVRATEDDNGYSGSWRLHGYALCAPAPAGLGYGWSTSASGSPNNRTQSTSCAPGKKVISSGGLVTGGGADVGLTAVLPAADLTSAVAQAYEDEDGYGGNWTLTVWLVCANALPGLERVVAGPQQSFPSASVVACPSGKHVHGVGGGVNNGNGEVSMAGAYPYVSSGAYAFGWPDESGFGGNWSPYAIAICAS